MFKPHFFVLCKVKSAANPQFVFFFNSDDLAECMAEADRYGADEHFSAVKIETTGSTDCLYNPRDPHNIEDKARRDRLSSVVQNQETRHADRISIPGR